ncbi:transposase [Microcystis aeruginosa NIES-843]|uniref:Transposase n=1 Tax=Microcystis aeruginosa (strain NIES-843 / IAM M-2473) TaxID=449447 RepID=B0JHG7_MICAN|nr:transposase [Microcystis aeruginosa NIES-843]
MLYSKKLGSIRVCAAYFFGKIGCNGRLFVFLDKNNYFFKKTLFYFFVGYFILWKSLTIPITLVLDNARYQKCKIVEELALSLSIELLYLPSYSPNLNLIERLWKFVKKKCLYGKYYENFSDFSSAIYECLNDAHLKHKKELDSLLTLRFQKFNKSQIMNV